MFRSIRSLLALGGKKKPVHTPSKFFKNTKFSLESLEDRTAPTVTITSNGGGDFGSINMAENTTAVTTVTSTVTQPDSPPVVYSLGTLNGDPQQAALFNIDPSTGVVTFKTAPDFENPQGSGAPPSNTYFVAVKATASSTQNSDQQILIINVVNANDPPVANPDTLSGVQEDAPPRTIPIATLLANDTTGQANSQDTPNPQTLTFVGVANAVGGNVQFDQPNGNVIFTFTPNFNGNASFTYIITDNGTTQGNADPKTAQGTVTIPVQAVPDAPVTLNGSLTAFSGQQKEGTLLATDADGDTLTYSLVNVSNAHGSVQLAPNATNPGRYLYTADGTFTGQASFTFQVTDSTGLTSNVSTVFITVAQGIPNNPPVAFDGSLSTAEDTPATGTLVATDVDAGTTLTYFIFGSSNQHGTVTILNDKTGSYVYVPDNNYNGPASFLFFASDGSLNSNVATVSVVVSAVNDTPSITTNTLTISEGGSVTLGPVNLNTTDPDNTAAQLTYTVNQVVNGQFELTSNFNQPITTFTQAQINSGAVRFVHNGNEGAPSYTLTVNDGTTGGNATSAPSTVTVVFSNVNDAPVGQAATISTLRDTPVSGQLVATDVDLTTPPGLTYSLAPGTTPVGGTVIINSNGTFTFTPTAGSFGTASFQFVANDNNTSVQPFNQSSAPATITVNVQQVNAPPVANNNGFITNEDTPIVNGSLTATDTDQNLIYTIVNTSNANGSVVLTNSQAPGSPNTTGTFTYIPNPNYNNTTSSLASFTFKATDPTGADSNIATVTIQVNPVNDAPVALPQTLSALEDNPIGGILQGTDVDGDALTYNIVGTPVNGSVILLVNTTGQFSFQPASNFNGIARFQYSVTDTSGVTSAPATVTINVASVNDAPTFNTPVSTISVPENTTAVTTVVATDVDFPPDTLTYSIVPLGSDQLQNSQFQIVASGANAGALSFISPKDFENPNGSPAGGVATNTYSVNVRVSDGKGGTADQLFFVNVTNANDPPIGTNDTLSPISEGSAPFTVPVATLLANDLTGAANSQDGTQTLALVAVSGTNPQLAAATGGTASLISKGAPIASASESGLLVNIQTTTPHGLNVGENVIISGVNIAGYNGVYTITSVPTANSFTYIAFTPGLGTGSGGTATVTTAVLFTPNATFNGTANFTYRLQDTGGGNNDIASAIASFTVTGVNDDAPTVKAGQAFSIPENSPVGTVVGTIDASDPDAGQTLTYSITGTAFAINPVTGQITVADQAQIANRFILPNPSFTLTATARDNGIPPLSGSATFTINLNAPNTAANQTPVGVTDQLPDILEDTPNTNSPLAIAILSATSSGATATITTAGIHPFVVGQSVQIAGITPTSYTNGGNSQTVTITSVPTPNTFTYTLSGTNANLPNATGLGTVRSVGSLGNAVINTASESGNTVTFTTSAAHGFQPGQPVTVAGLNGGTATAPGGSPNADNNTAQFGYNGTFLIASVPSPTSFTVINNQQGLGPITGASGTAQTGDIWFIPMSSLLANDFTGNNVNEPGQGLAITRLRNNDDSRTVFRKLSAQGGGNPDSTAIFSKLFNIVTATESGPTATITTGTNITAATESGTTVTATTAGAANLLVPGQTVTIAGFTGAQAGYNGTVTVLSATATSFTYTAPAGLPTPAVAPFGFVSTPHNLLVGETVMIAGSGGKYNGNFVITSVPSPTTFTYTTVAGQGTVSGGTAKVNTNIALSINGDSTGAQFIVYDRLIDTGFTNGDTDFKENTSQVRVNVNLISLNDPPTIANNSGIAGVNQIFSIASTAPNGTNVNSNLALATTDRGNNQGPNDRVQASDDNTLTYSLSGPGSSAFTINPTNGQISVADRNQLGAPGNQFDLIVTVTDNGSPVLSTSAPIRIAVKSANTDAPVLTLSPGANSSKLSPGDGKGGSVSFSYPENQSGNVFTISAADADGTGPGNQGFYFVILTTGNGGGPDERRFKVASTTATTANIVFEDSGNGGTINSPSATSPIDSDGNSSYNLIVRVYDNGSPARFTDQNITVNVVRTAATSPIVYFNPSFSGDAGQTLILDADPITPGNQPATFGINAFNGVTQAAFNRAIGSATTLGQIKFVPNAGSSTISIGGDNIDPIPANVQFVVDAGVTATLTARLRSDNGQNPFIKGGAGTLILTNTDSNFTFAGTSSINGELVTGVTVNNGRLRISSNAVLGNSSNVVTVNSPGVFESTGNWSTSRTFNLNNGATLRIADSTLTMNSAAVNGGFLSGPGAITTGINNGFQTVFTGTRSTSSLVLNAADNTTFLGFDNGGILNVAAGKTATMAQFNNTSSGKLTVNGTALVTDFVTNGQMTVSSTGTVTNVGTAGLSFGGGSVTTVQAAGQARGVIDLGPSTGVNRSTLAGGLMINNGVVGSVTPGADLVVDFGGVAKGTGTYVSVITQNGGIFSPGSSPGTATTSNLFLNGGGTFQFEIANAAGTAGQLSGWDLVNVLTDSTFPTSPKANFTATPANQYNVNIVSLLDSGDHNTPGLAANFDSHKPYSWKFIDATSPDVTTTGTFDPAAFNIVTTGFLNPTDGTFSIAATDNGKSLSVVYTPNAAAATTTTLTATTNATTGGTLVTLNAAVSPSPDQAGTVTFMDNGTAIPGGSNVAIFGGIATFSTSALAAGSHTITAAYSGASGFAASTSNSQTVVIADSSGNLPKVVSVTPNAGLSAFAGAQHSRVVNLTVAFDQAVQLDQGAVTMALHTNGVSYGGAAQANGYGSVPTLNVTTADNKVFTITFAGNTDVGADGFQSLKDGVYDLKIDGAKVHVQGSPAVTMGGSSTTVIHRLFGDTGAATTPANGVAGVDFEAVVNSGDNLAFRGAFNNAANYKAYLDFNGDGTINSGDNLQFRTRFNKSLTWKV